ncbi:DUF4955 domain-containing protein [Planctomycetota bacterium]
MKINIIAILLVGLATMGFSAELVGSLLTATGGNICTDQQSVGPLVTRTTDGDAHTRGVIEGSITIMAGDKLGAGGYTGMDIRSGASDTQYIDTVLYAGHTSLIVFDFDFSAYLSTHKPGTEEGEFTYSLDLDYDWRLPAEGAYDAVMYLSYNRKKGRGFSLDTTDILLLNPTGGIAQAALIADTSKYVSVGTLPANVVTDFVSFDITSHFVNSSDGKFRLIVANPEYHADLQLQNASGIMSKMVSAPLTPEISGLWSQFAEAKNNGNEPILPDYSYAGYQRGETSIPRAQWDIFDVTAYGAVPDDRLSDRTAVQSAITAAEANGSGIVFFPPGLFRISEEAGVDTGINIVGENIVVRGSGSGPGGTEIFMREYLVPTNPDASWTAPQMFDFGPAPGNYVNTWQTTITKDADRESFSITVADTSTLQPEMLVELSMNNPAANADFLDGLEPWDIWTTTIDSGINVQGERHRIQSIGRRGVVTFYEPIHCNIRAAHGWSVSSSALLRGWGVEDIHFRGNLPVVVGDHFNAIHDAGWKFLAFFCGESPYLRSCRFTDCSSAAAMDYCYGGTILNCSIEGNQAQSSFISSYYSYGTLMAYCTDMIFKGAVNGFAANSGAVGTVITRCKNSNQGFDWHASWPYCTLLDACSGGLMGSGGYYGNLPNHMRHLTLWNFNQTADKVYYQYDWWKPRVDTEYYSGAKVVHPIIVGYHGRNTTFKPESCQIIESHGTPVEPASLYESQLKLRLGILPAWIDEARNRYDFFMANGYWP